MQHTVKSTATVGQRQEGQHEGFAQRLKALLLLKGCERTHINRSGRDCYASRQHATDGGNFGLKGGKKIHLKILLEKAPTAVP